MAGKLKDIAGQRFNMLTVTGFSHMRGESSYWHVKCDCGNEKIMAGSSIKSKSVYSCGCYAKKERSQRMKKHGLSKTPLYACWIDIKGRCNNPNNQKYKYYGSRGITYCREWEDFMVFYEWAINNGYKKGLQIDRIDNNGNYEPSNCRFVTSKENINNRGCTAFCDINGIRKPVSEWAKEIGINRDTLLYRIKLGWEGPQLLQQSKRQQGKSLRIR